MLPYKNVGGVVCAQIIGGSHPLPPIILIRDLGKPYGFHVDPRVGWGWVRGHLVLLPCLVVLVHWLGVFHVKPRAEE
mgnify:CR=1 FL=1|jgi:hypothetical protein